MSLTKFSAQMLGYESRGIPIDRIDTHSLRSGGACALKLAGFDEVVIKKMGRWSPDSNSFMEYVQQQLSSFSAGMAARMSQVEVFTNMEGATRREDIRASTIY